MVGCSIRNCKSRSVKGGTIMFFSFPTKESVAKEWLRYCGPKTTTKHGRVCSNHFLASDYIKSLRLILLKESPRRCRKLKPDAIPLLHIHNTDLPDAIHTIEFGNKDKPEVSHILETDDTYIPDASPSPQIDDIETKNISIVSIDIPSKTVCSSNIKCFPGKCNTTPASEIPCSSKVIEKSDNIITIPLAEHKQLQKTSKKFNVLRQNLEKIFTSGQIRCLMTPNMRRVRWSAEDIAAAISLKSISPKSYCHLRAIGIPLPSLRTLRNWASKFGPGQKKSLEAKNYTS